MNKTKWIWVRLIILSCVFVGITVFIFLKNTTYGFYFILGIIVWRVIEKLWNPMAKKYNEKFKQEFIKETTKS